MLRAVFCLNGPDAVNGPNVWLTRHLPALARRGVEPVVLYLSWAPAQPCRYRQALAQAGIRVVTVGLGRFIEENVVAIAKAASACDADVFVPNYSVAGYYAARFLRAAGVVTVGTLHSDDPYYHDIIDVFVAGAERWRLSGVVGVSDYIRTLVTERTLGELPFLHAPYGAPVPALRARWLPERFRLIYSGRLVERQKRVHRVAAGMLAAAQVCAQVEGVLYGEGPEGVGLEAELAGSGGRVRLGGLLAPQEMQKAMLEAQAFVLLSDFEGLSIALMEAMACGLVPIVSPMRSGVADLVMDGVTGFVVPADDPGALAAVVARLVDDTELWNRVSEAARGVVLERRYTVEACADAWAKFLGELTVVRESRKPLVVPPCDEWELPPRSGRPEGMRLEDRRAAWPRMQAASREGRPVFLWGASRAGEVFLEGIAGRNLRLAGFIDTNPSKRGQHLCGLRISGPQDLSALLDGGHRPFVVITSQYETDIAAVLCGMGLKEDVDFAPG